MNYSKIISLIGFIKPKYKKQEIMSYSTITMTKQEINNTLANYFNFTNFFKIHCTLQTKICIMNFTVLIIKKRTKPKKVCLLTNQKQKTHKLCLLFFQFYHLLIRLNYINKKQSFLFSKRDILDQIFLLTLKQVKNFFLKKIIKKIQKLILYIKQKIKQNSYNNVSFFIKIINFKIINTFTIFCTFLNIFDFLKKIIYFMYKQKNFFYKIKSFFYSFFNCNKVKIFYYHIATLQNIFYKNQNKLRDKHFYTLFIKFINNFYFTIPFCPKKLCFHFDLKKYYQKLYFLKKIFNFFLFFKKKSNLWFKLNITKILVNLKNSQVVNLQFIFSIIMRYLKMIYNQQDFFKLKSFFLKKFKKIILKVASFIRFFLSKLLWKWVNKQHPQNSSKYLLKKYWVFLRNFSIFYFFEKTKLKL